MIVKLSLLTILGILSLGSVLADQNSEDVIFTVHRANETFRWDLGANLTPNNCTKSEKFAFVVHGWESSANDWSPRLIQKLLKYRGGCVIYVNWGRFSDDLSYDLITTSYWPRVSDILTQKLKQLEREGVSSDNIYMYGHSLGGRMVIDAGLKFGNGKIGQIDTCDNAGPGFYVYGLFHNARNAAKNVQCIHTSTLAGTAVYDCHQDWLMGNCGVSQPEANDAMWFLCLTGFCPEAESAVLSHDICNDFYINAFDNNFVASNVKNCIGVLSADQLPENFKMGYMEGRRSSTIQGKIAAPTSKTFPFNVV